MKPGQPAQPDQTDSQSLHRPGTSSPEPPVVIITSSNPASVGVKQPAPFDMPSAGAFSPAQPPGSQNEARFQQEPGVEDEDRCPSPIPVTLDDFGSDREGEEGADDLQGMELPWASRRSQSPAGSSSSDDEAASKSSSAD